MKVLTWLSYFLVSLVTLGVCAAQAQTKDDSSLQLPPNKIGWGAGAYVLFGDVDGSTPASLAASDPMVSVTFYVYDSVGKQLLARYVALTRVEATSERTILLVIPQPPRDVSPVIGVELQGVTVRLDLQNDRTFQAVQTCKVNSMRQLVRACTRAFGVVVDRSAEQLLVAGRDSSRQRAEEIQGMRNSISRNLQIQHESQMNIIRNIAPCKPGEYCPR